MILSTGSYTIKGFIPEFFFGRDGYECVGTCVWCMILGGELDIPPKGDCVNMMPGGNLFCLHFSSALSGRKRLEYYSFRVLLQ